MKNRKYLYILVSVILGGVLILMYLNANIIGDLFCKARLYNVAVDFYKLRYNRDNDAYSLKMLAYCSDNYSIKAVYYCKLLEKKDYLKGKSRSEVDAIKDEYMVCLYESNNNAKFRQYYQEQINSFENPIQERALVIHMIIGSKVSKKDDYQFAINECNYLIPSIDSGQQLRMMSMYHSLGDLYAKIEDNKKSEEYYTKSNELSSEIKKTQNIK